MDDMKMKAVIDQAAFSRTKKFKTSGHFRNDDKMKKAVDDFLEWYKNNKPAPK